MGLAVVEKKPQKKSLLLDAAPVRNFIPASYMLIDDQAESDAAILLKAEEIRRDPARLRKAQVLLRGAFR